MAGNASLSALLQEMAWHDIGAKPFLEAMLILGVFKYNPSSIRHN